MMQYIILAIAIAFISSVSLFRMTEETHQKKERGSASYYTEQLRYALSDFRQQHPDIEQEVSFADLSTLPKGLVERHDVRNFIDDKGFYIVFTESHPGLADQLVRTYSISNSNVKDETSNWNVGFYHIGFNLNGCLRTSRHYLNESSLCSRPLPAAIPEGTLVMTDRDADSSYTGDKE